ncbi:hypothetical protein Cch01nite_08150 [Cellulomonas chitinilytica]|uniref:PKD domain-containing protein n=2 Tax=Cellulomonas chitinilytica TaxID=398759 RepID=A0A919U051_9CELL|nr:hypothetical protein Cch01nite_08150 [Cellulomonas chitinilytica]
MLAGILSVGGAQTAAHGETAKPVPVGPTGAMWSNLKDNAAYLDAFAGEQNRRHVEAESASIPPELKVVQVQRALMCDTNSAIPTTPLNGPCPEASGTVGLNYCDGAEPVLPLWRRTRATPADPWNPWVLAAYGGCPADLLPTMSVEDFRRLPLPAPAWHMQPNKDWVLVNMETIVYSTDTPQQLRTDLLGYGVDVIATPERYVWDFGDDSKPLSTHRQGHPWPGFDLFHVYEQAGTGTITATTIWSGRYRVDGDTQWHDILGTAETTATSAPFDIVERRAHLVATDCLTDPTQADC